jgi:hypothetical protein
MNPHSIRQQLHRMAKSKLALSTVVTTLIVLVVAVLLAGVVTYFAINVTSTRVQEESLALAKQHVWFDSSSGKAQAAIMVINAGGRDVVVGKLTVRGQVCDWSKVFYNLTSESISGDLSANSTLTDGGTISVGGSNHIFKQATNDLTIQSGKTLIIYISNPDSISVNDIGLTVSINIFTSQAMYYKETNVQGTSGTQTISGSVNVSEITLLYAAAYTHSGDPNFDQVALVLSNVGESDEVISLSDLIVDGVQKNSDIKGHCIVASATSSLPCLVDDAEQVQSSPLSWSTNSLTLHAGRTAIVYFNSLARTFVSGNNYSVGISLDDGQTVTLTVECGSDSHIYP